MLSFFIYINFFGSLPCRAGMHFHTETGPWLANWPRDTSSKKIGIPAIPNMVR